MADKDLLLIGGGDFCKSVIQALEATPWNVVGILDNDPFLKEINGIPVLGPETRLGKLREQYGTALLTTGYTAGPRVRRYLYQMLEKFGYEIPAIISPLAHVSHDVIPGKGCIIMPHAVIKEGVKLGNNCLVDTNVTLMANVEIGDHSILEKEATILPDVRTGFGVHICQGAQIGKGLNLGKRCYVDAHVSLQHDLSPYKIVRV